MCRNFRLDDSGSNALLSTIIGNLPSAAIAILLIILEIIGIVNAAQGKKNELPVIGKIRILKY